MTWTYSNTSLSTNLSRVRQLIGDTNSKDPLLTDEEIAAASEYSAADLAAAASDGDVNIPLAASRCCLPMLSAVARRIDTSGPRFGATRSQIFQHFKDLKMELENEANATATPVLWSGNSAADATSIESDSDFNQPAFKVGQDDY